MSAAATAQINARISPELKRQGDAALAAAGITPTQAVRALWELAAEHAERPEIIEQALFPERAEQAASEAEQRRNRRLAAARRGPHIVEDAIAAAGIDTEANGASTMSYDELKELAYTERYGEQMGW